MTKKNQSNKTVKSNVSVDDLILSDEIENVAKKENKQIIGFDSDKDILNEINNRLFLVNKNTFLMKHIPKHLSRIALKQLVPDMLTCRFPAASNKLNKGFAFIQMKSEEIVDAYIKKLNETKIGNSKLLAIKINPPAPFTSLKEFDLKSLYFNGLKPESKLNDIKEIYPDAKILFPVNKDKSSQGSLTLSFKNEQEALEAFAENKLCLNNVKVQLTYLIKERLKDIFSFERPDEIVEEIKKRFDLIKNRNIVIKNLPKQYSLENLRSLLPSMRSCKIMTEKCLGFGNFHNSQLAADAIKLINDKKTDKRSMFAFTAKMPVFDFDDLSQFELESLHISNLPSSATKEDIEAVFDNCAVDFPLNPDKTSIGSATLTFQTKEACLSAFEKNGVTVGGVAVDVNFQRLIKVEKKVEESVKDGKTVVASGKRKLQEDLDEEKSFKKAKSDGKMSEVRKPVAESTVNKKRKYTDFEVDQEEFSNKKRKTLVAKKVKMNEPRQTNGKTDKANVSQSKAPQKKEQKSEGKKMKKDGKK